MEGIVEVPNKRIQAIEQPVRSIKMSKSKGTKLKGIQLAKRLTGISTPIGGISWNPPVDERDIAKQLLVFLEDRRVLFMPYDMEVEPYVMDSIIEIRQRLTKALELISRSSVLGESIAAMRANRIASPKAGPLSSDGTASRLMPLAYSAAASHACWLRCVCVIPCS